MSSSRITVSELLGSGLLPAGLAGTHRMESAVRQIKDLLMLDGPVIKSPDEIMLLTRAAAMVDGVYQDIVEALKPGIPGERDRRDGEQRLYEMGSPTA